MTTGKKSASKHCIEGQTRVGVFQLRKFQCLFWKDSDYYVDHLLHQSIKLFKCAFVVSDILVFFIWKGVVSSSKKKSSQGKKVRGMRHQVGSRPQSLTNRQLVAQSHTKRYGTNQNIVQSETRSKLKLDPWFVIKFFNLFFNQWVSYWGMKHLDFQENKQEKPRKIFSKNKRFFIRKHLKWGLIRSENCEGYKKWSDMQNPLLCWD